MANIWNDGTFRAFGTDINQLLLVKNKRENTCWKCKTKIPKGSYCLSKNYRWLGSRICLNCAYEFLENFIKSVDNFKKIGQNTLRDIKKNKNKYEANNLSAKI